MMPRMLERSGSEKTMKAVLSGAVFSGLISAAFVLMATGSAHAGVPATFAGDICPGTCTNNAAVCHKDADCTGGATCTLPAVCNVTQQYDITPGAILDFKTSTVNVTQAGQFNFDTNSGSILSGPLNVSTANPAIDANGIGTTGTDSGSIHIDARRLCNAGPVPCVNLADCQLGACDTRRCTGRASQHCLGDTDCVGACINRRCNNTKIFTRCTSNTDCNFGTCPAQLQCRNRDFNPVSCSSNTDCEFGDCTIGTASISMGGAIVGNSDFPASITMRAADNISISKSVNLTGSAIDSDGGDITVEAMAGAVTVTGNIVADSGGDGQGGAVELDAATDVTVAADIDVTGGDFDGGSVEINADRDAFINRSLLANANSGEGYGGELLLHAERDMIFTGASALSRTKIETSGHTSADNSAGDGGSQDFSTGRDLSMNVNTRMTGNGASPNGYGSDFSFDVGRNLVIDGGMIAKAEGVHGQGGQLDIFADGTAKISSTASIDLTGGDSGGGDMGLESTGNTDFAGIADVTGSNGGAGGSTFLYSSADTSLSGSLVITSLNGGNHEVDACRVTLTGTGKVTSTAANGENKLLSRESMKLLAGSKMTTGVSGKNELEYRSAAKPPVIQGTVTPAPIKIVNEQLTGCPICGNNEIDQGETCDDGNTADGDACTSTCQNAKCVQQTAAPGYPTVPLCSDNDNCSTDTCNTALNGGTCQHSAKTCDDSIACTSDSCNPVSGQCNNVGNDSLCNDQNPCTNDICAPGTGCTGVANAEPCNDNDACTENDGCVAKECQGTPIQGCAVCGDGVKTSDEACDDGNASYAQGEYCGVACALIPCGKMSDTSTTLKASDALYVLKAAVNPQLKCTLQVCDVDGSGKVAAGDALRILKVSVGQVVALLCPAPA